MKVMTKYDLILGLLQEDEKYRESDRALMARIWWDECQYKGITSVKEFLRQFVNGNFTNPESIRRPRALITNVDFPHLASKETKRKRAIEEDNARKDLGYGT